MRDRTRSAAITTLRVLNSAMSIASQVYLAAMEKPAIVKQEAPIANCIHIQK